MDTERIRDNLQSVERRIADAARRAGRPAEAIQLVAVTKKTSLECIEAIVACGVRDLGENYPQELWSKVEALASLQCPLRWHLIGHLQTNKVKKTLTIVQMIHSVDSLKLLKALDEAARDVANPPSVCLQVNTSAEPSKHGWDPEQIIVDAESIAACRSIPVVGLMTMAALGTNAESARGSFVRLRELRDRLRQKTALPLPELSMGMSSDFETAVEEGATLLRVGSALFAGAQS